MDKFKKFSMYTDLDKSEFQHYYKNLIIKCVLDLDQSTNSEKLDYMINSSMQFILSKDYLSINEVDITFDTGMQNGFGVFKKITVQIIKEWFKNREKEIAQKELYVENKLRQKEQYILNPKSKFGKACVIAINLRNAGILTKEIEKRICVNASFGSSVIASFIPFVEADNSFDQAKKYIENLDNDLPL